MKNNFLARKMASYSSLASALAGISNSSDAQILYTNVDPEDTVFVCGTQLLDLNNDGNFDFLLVAGEHIFNYWKGEWVAQAPGNTAINSVMGVCPSATSTYTNGSANYLKLPFQLNFMDQIGATSPWVKPVAFEVYLYCDAVGLDITKQAVLNLDDDGTWLGNWNQPAAEFIGMKINVNTESFYGWARISVDPLGNWFVLKDYAVNTIAGEGLGAGEGMAVGIQNLQSIAITVAPNPASDNVQITILQNSEQAILTMFNIEGREMMIPVSKNGDGWNADLKALSDGLYILEIKTGTQTYRNMVVISR